MRHDFERRDAGSHGKVILRIGRSVHHGAVYAVKDFVVDAFTGQHCAHRDVAARQRLGKQYHIGLDAPVLDCEEPSGATEPGLTLVGHKQRAMPAAQRRRFAQIVVHRHVDAFALDRLDDERGDVA